VEIFPLVIKEFLLLSVPGGERACSVFERGDLRLEGGLAFVIFDVLSSLLVHLTIVVFLSHHESLFDLSGRCIVIL
jgi:hypothetical protein